MLIGMARLQGPAGSISLPTVTWLGRDDACTLSVPDPSVAARHALILAGPTAWWLLDLTDSERLLLNGEALDTIEALYDGDEIELASTRLTFDAPDFPCPRDFEGQEIRERRLPRRSGDLWQYLPSLSSSVPDHGGRLLQLLVHELPALRLRLLDGGDGEGRERLCKTGTSEQALPPPPKTLGPGSRQGQLFSRRIHDPESSAPGDPVHQLLAASLLRDEESLLLTAERLFPPDDPGGPFQSEDILLMAMAAAELEGRWVAAPEGPLRENIDDTRPLDRSKDGKDGP